MRAFSVSCEISVQGVGEPDYSFTPPPAIFSECGEVEAIDTYLHRLLYDPAFYPYLQNSTLIVPAAKEISVVKH